MEVHIKAVEKITLTVEETELIVSIKEKIQDKIGVPQCQQLLILDDQELENQKKVSDCNIKTGKVIELRKRLLVQKANGQTISLEFDPSEELTVKRVKNKLFTDYRLQYDKQRISWKFYHLDLESTLIYENKLELNMDKRVEPVVDEQGNKETCTRFGIAKCITNALDKCKYIRDGEGCSHKIDVRQEQIVHALREVHCDDFIGKRPSEFNGVKIKIQALNLKKEVTIKLDVKDVAYKEPVDVSRFDYVLVHPKDWWNYKNCTHCLYVERYDDVGGLFFCMNSQGHHDPHPILRDDSVLYVSRVSVTLSE